jgi:hypothetical protein
MPIFSSPVKVPQPGNSTQDSVAFGDFVTSQLGLNFAFDSVALTVATLDAIFDEIWNADVNATLVATQGSRNHIPPSDSRTRSLELVPDEWVVLPAMPPPSVDWKLNALPVTSGDDVDAICKMIVDWAAANDLTLPPLPAPSAPGNAIDGDALSDIFFNAQLRRGTTADVVYFYAASGASTPVDLPPSTDAGGSVTVAVRATPDWLVPFWHYIDRLKAEAAVHSQAYDSLRNMVADGKVAVEALNVADNAMTLLEQQPLPPLPTGFFGKVMDAYGRTKNPLLTQTLDIADFHAKLRALRDVASTEYVDNANFPQNAEFLTSLGKLSAIENEKAFSDLYTKFNAARASFPVTENAYQIACASYIVARVLHPESDPYWGNILDIFDKGMSGTTPVSQEVDLVFNGTVKKQIVDDAAALTTLTVGNAPGPWSLWLSLTKLSLIRQIQQVPPGAGSAKNTIQRRYVSNLAKAMNIAESVLTEWDTEQSAKGLTPSAQARAVSARMRALDTKASSVHSGPGFVAVLSLLDLWAIYSAIGQAKKDGRVDAVGDGLAGITAAAGLAGAVTQGLQQLGAAAADSTRTNLLGKAATILGSVFSSDEAMKSLDKLARFLGRAAAVGGAIVGVIQIAQGIRDSDLAKIAAGSGAVLASIGFWVGEFATARAPILFARSATAEILGITFTEAGLVELGACFGLIGVLISLAALAATHWDVISAFLAKQVTPGTKQFIDVVLTQLKAAHVVSAGPASVRTALDAAVSAAAAAKFSVWLHDFGNTNDLPTQKLRAIRMGPDDIQTFGLFPVDQSAGSPG